MYNNTVAHAENSTDSFDSDFIKHPRCETTSLLIYLFPFIICALGIVGNLLSYVVIHIAYRASAMNLLLKALAIADSAYLLFESTLDTLLFAHADYPNLEFSLWALAKVSQYASIWHLVVIAGFRFTAICYPFKAARLCSARRAAFAIAAMWVLACLLHGPYVLQHLSEPVAEYFDSSGGYLIYDVFIIGCMVFVIPFGLLLFFNARILHAVWTASRNIFTNRHTYSEESSSELYEVSKVVIAITTVFFITYLPYPLNNIDYYYFDNQLLPRASCLARWFNETIKFKTQYISSSVNFLIYCVLRQSFRRKMAQLCCCQRSQHRYLRQSIVLRRRMRNGEASTMRSRGSNTAITEVQLFH